MAIGKPEPIRSLTTIRGYLACWVLLYHLSKELFLLLPATTFFAPVVHAGHFAVPGFFVLSGYVLWINYESWFKEIQFTKACRFLLLRFARLYPVHLVTLLATFVMVVGGALVGVQFPNNRYSPTDFLRNLLLIHTWVPRFHFNWNYPSWSISSEWFAYLCFPAICLLLHRIKSSGAKIAAMWARALFMVLFAWYGEGLQFREMLGILPLFTAGCCLGLLVGQCAAPASKSYLPECILLSIFCMPFVLEANALQAAEYLLLAGLVGSLGWLKTQASDFWSNTVGNWVGEISYSLYMCHFLVIKVANQIVPIQTLSNASFVVRCLTFALYLAAIFGLSWVTYLAVERPCQRYFKSKRKEIIADNRSQIQPSGAA